MNLTVGFAVWKNGGEHDLHKSSAVNAEYALPSSKCSRALIWIRSHKKIVHIWQSAAAYTINCSSNDRLPTAGDVTLPNPLETMISGGGDI